MAFGPTNEIPKHYWIRTEDPDVLADLDKQYGLEKAMDPRSEEGNWVTLEAIKGILERKITHCID